MGADCDDSDPANFPGNPELCDNQDNNCDTVVDEGFDVDGDGFTTCALPVSDCNDTNPNVNPLAQEGPPGDPTCTDTLDNARELLEARYHLVKSPVSRPHLWRYKSKSNN